ncbi:hypothetical protein ACIBQX_50445 [Nonomuraea sp. NPDC049714]|uniref:hypothetical protein n=1 Tax=Nonomuraea sp. NPDC049714 TaxID=3364357 RepID=UPI00379BD2AF
MAEISEREAVLWDRIAAGPHPTRDAKKHAAKARETAATYRVFPELATARDWCAHCNVWIGTGRLPSQ